MKEIENPERRSLIKGLIGMPFIGAIWGGAIFKKGQDQGIRKEILKELNIEIDTPSPYGTMSGDPIRIGIVGYGIRGKQLVQALGFLPKADLQELRDAARANKNDFRYHDFVTQDNLNVRLTGVCDLFDVRAEEAIEAGTTDNNKPKRFRTYQEMVQSPDIDAVVIATPDHHHAPIAIAAAKGGKHVYVEKCLTHHIPETYELYDAIKSTGVVMQLGHQNRQTQSYITAKDIIGKNVLGHVSLVQTNTNRNCDEGAWQYDIHEKASSRNIDWEQFLGHAPKIPFNKEHFFRWRKWWAYGTGLAGDLMTHSFDSVNCILNMGIPKYVTASGGIYTHRDGREVPDVFQVTMEYPNFSTGRSQEPGKEMGMTFLYSATLGNQYNRGTMLMGHDGMMRLGDTLKITADPVSTRFKDMLKQGIINDEIPIFTYDPSAGSGVDAVTSATAKYFAQKGLLYTYRDGKRVDSTHLHIKEWLSCIRHGGTPSCDIEEGFVEAIAAHMATLSFKTGKRLEWDHQARKIVNLADDQLMA
jgi:predicted dehydrogenase